MWDKICEKGWATREKKTRHTRWVSAGIPWALITGNLGRYHSSSQQAQKLKAQSWCCLSSSDNTMVYCKKCRYHYTDRLLWVLQFKFEFILFDRGLEFLRKQDINSCKEKGSESKRGTWMCNEDEHFMESKRKMWLYNWKGGIFSRFWGDSFTCRSVNKVVKFQHCLKKQNMISI